MTAFALFPSFIAQGPETLILDPSLLSLGSDDYHIRLSNGTPLLRVGGKSLSMSGRKKVFDEQGTHLFDVVRSVMHMHSTYVVEDARGVGVVEVKWGMKGTCPDSGLDCGCGARVGCRGYGMCRDERELRANTVLGSKATATFAGQSGKQGGLSLKGGLGDRSAEIVDESQGSEFTVPSRYPT